MKPKNKKKIGRPKKVVKQVTREQVQERWAGQSFCTSLDDPILQEMLALTGPVEPPPKK